MPRVMRRGGKPNDTFLITTIIVLFAIFLAVLLNLTKGFRFGRSNSLMYLYYDEGDEGNNSSEPIIEYLSNKNGNGNENVTKAKSAVDFLYSKDSGDRIVEFYNPWCGHCIRFKSEYIKIARKVTQLDPSIKFYAISCVAHGDICRQENILGVPTVRLYKKGSIEGQILPHRISANFILRQFDDITDDAGIKNNNNKDEESEVVHLVARQEKEDDSSTKNYLYKTQGEDVGPVIDFVLSDEETKDNPLFSMSSILVEKQNNVEGDTSSQQEVMIPHFLSSTDNEDRVVEFYAPWCGHCQHFKPEYIQIAKDTVALNNKIQFYAVSCTAHDKICDAFEVHGYPTVVLFKKGTNEKIVLNRATGDLTPKSLIGKFQLSLDELKKSSSQIGSNRPQPRSRPNNLPPKRNNANNIAEINLPQGKKGIIDFTHFLNGLGRDAHLVVQLYDTECKACFPRHMKQFGFVAGVFSRENNNNNDEEESSKEKVLFYRLSCRSYETICDNIFGEKLPFNVDSGPRAYLYLSGFHQSPILLEKYKLSSKYITDATNKNNKQNNKNHHTHHIPEKEESTSKFLYNNKEEDTGPVIEFMTPETTGEASTKNDLVRPDFIFSSMTDNRVVQFYSPYCGHCQAYKPTYIQLAKDTETFDPSIKFYTVSCVAYSDICREMNIRGTPTVVLFHNNGGDGSADILEPVNITAPTEKELTTEFLIEKFHLSKENWTIFANERKKLDDLKSHTRFGFLYNTSPSVPIEDREVLEYLLPRPNLELPPEFTLTSSSPVDEKKLPKFISITDDDDNNTDTMIGSKPRIVQFYSNECLPCLYFRDTYKKLATNTKEIQPNVQFYAVQCRIHSELCHDLGITFPHESIERNQPFMFLYGINSDSNSTSTTDDEHEPIYLLPNITTPETISQLVNSETKNDLETITYPDGTNVLLLSEKGKLTTQYDNKQLKKDKVDKEEQLGSTSNNGVDKELPNNNNSLEDTYEDDDDLTIPAVHSPRNTKKYPRTQNDIYKDAYNSFHFNLQNGIFNSLGELSSERKEAFHSWITLLEQTLPLNWKEMHKALTRILFDFDAIVVSHENMNEAMKPYQPKEINWTSSCTKGTQYLGFTCGVWELFHIMSIGIVERNSLLSLSETTADDDADESESEVEIISTLKAADTVRSFMQHFFGCIECVDNFLDMYDSCALDRCSMLSDEKKKLQDHPNDWKNFAIWLWAAHNDVNIRLMKEQAEAERENILNSIQENDILNAAQWPSREDCGDCWNNEGFDQNAVYEYLKNEYWPSDENGKFSYYGSSSFMNPKNKIENSVTVSVGNSFFSVQYVMLFFGLSIMVLLVFSRKLKKVLRVSSRRIQYTAVPLSQNS